MDIKDEDIPDPHLALIGKRRTFYSLHLEGAKTPDVWATIDAFLADILAQTKGALIDVQANKWETATKQGLVAHDVAQPRKPHWMTFWFKDGARFHATGFADLLTTLGTILPAAVPRRLGLTGPLQGKVTNGDTAPLVDTFQTNGDIILRSAAPFGDVLVSVPSAKRFEEYNPRHFARRDHLLGTVAFAFKPKLFEDKAATTALFRAFETLSLQLDVVYAEIRTDNDMPGGTGWFWNGLPHGPVLARCIGPDDCGVWPDAVTAGRRIGPNHVVERAGRDATLLPSPPREMVLPLLDGGDRRSAPKLAPVFPFDYVYGEDTYYW